MVTIIVPVYGDWPSLHDCIWSLQKHTDAKLCKVLLVNDCGPEADNLERNIKTAIKNTPNFHYYRNQKNVGFLKNCNNAVLHLDKTNNDILLLNSDTKVTEGFLTEMQAVLKENTKIAAVSPRSNNATIATIPLSSIKQKGIEPEKSYQLFLQKKQLLPRYSVVPTAHGFCMLIRRSVINEYGLFDEVFGKGYGEEVDFCQRLRNKGYICALANWAYVFHQEARSFSLETKAKLLEVNNKIIRSRYPAYQLEVQDYIKQALKKEENVSASKVRPYFSGVKRMLKRFLH